MATPIEDEAGGRAGWPRRARVGLGLALLVALSLREPLLGVPELARLVASGRVGNDSIARVEKKFRSSMAVLPPHGAYGYRASGPLKLGRNSELEGENLPITQYVYAQYVLAPRVLDLECGRPVTVLDDLDAARVARGGGPGR